jgi:hypothetical protein
MTAIMPIDEPRPRVTVLGERADRRRFGEAGHYFRCKACNGWIDARDYVWIEDHDPTCRLALAQPPTCPPRRAAAAPGARSGAVALTVAVRETASETS